MVIYNKNAYSTQCLLRVHGSILAGVLASGFCVVPKSPYSCNTMLWCQTDLDYSYSLSNCCCNGVLTFIVKIYEEFFGEPNGSPHEVSRGFISLHKAHGFALGLSEALLWLLKPLI